jgi:hypothetical protein
MLYPFSHPGPSAYQVHAMTDLQVKCVAEQRICAVLYEWSRDVTQPQKHMPVMVCYDLQCRACMDAQTYFQRLASIRSEHARAMCGAVWYEGFGSGKDRGQGLTQGANVRLPP